jgi:hypothetical protein
MCVRARKRVCMCVCVCVCVRMNVHVCVCAGVCAWLCSVHVVVATLCLSECSQSESALCLSSP